MKVVGIDIGTTGICGVLLDAQSGAVLQSRTVLSEAFLPSAQPWEKIQDVSKIVRIAKEILDSFLDATQVAAIGLTGQMHGILYTDAQGRAVSPLYTWQDGRGNLPYKDTTYAAYLGASSGYGNVTDFYQRSNGLVPKTAVTYCTVMDYFGMVLCQATRPILHTSNAASLGCYRLTERCFDYDYTAQVTEGFSLLGSYRRIPVAVAIGDNQASVFATLAQKGDLLVNVGTGSQVSAVTDTPISSPEIECRPYVDGSYLAVGAALCGGRAYSLLKGFYQSVLETAGAQTCDVYSVMDAMLSQKTDTTLQVDPRFDGTRRDASIRGSVQGISTENFTPADLTLGVLRGMATELYTMYRAMGLTRSGLVGSGNGIRKNRALVRELERQFGAKMRVPLYQEEAACGAALFSMVASGIYADAGQVQQLIQYTQEEVK